MFSIIVPVHNVEAYVDYCIKSIISQSFSEFELILVVNASGDGSYKICKNWEEIGGSAIGALRDKGFIPWDDDIDIAMPRRDFEKLYKIIKKQYSFKYSMLHPQDKENYGRILPKIRLKGTEYKTILE